MAKDVAVIKFLEEKLSALHISTMHLVSALEALKNQKHIPIKFDPNSYGNFEVFLCATLLARFDATHFDHRDLAHTAYMSFLLDGVTFFGVRDIEIDPSNIIADYKKLAADKELKSEHEVTIRAIVHSKTWAIPNIVKAIFTRQYMTLIVLPRILNRLTEDNIPSFEDYKTKTLEYYNHLAQNFIPNLFIILRSPRIVAGFHIISQLSKLLLRFPMALFPQIIEFIKNLNQYSLERMNSFSSEEFYSWLKLNEYTEFCHGSCFLSTKDKEKIIISLLNRRIPLRAFFIEALMYMRFTIFFAQYDLLKSLEYSFIQVRACKQRRFDRSKEVFPAEELIYKAVLDALPDQSKNYLHSNYVCHLTGKEIDIVIIIPATGVKIAINIDGKDNHYYLGQEKENCKTELRNQALKKAGWLVICQPIPRNKEGFDEKFKHGLVEEVAQVLANLRQLTPLRVSFKDLLENKRINARILSFLQTDDTATPIQTSEIISGAVTLDTKRPTV